MKQLFFAAIAAASFCGAANAQTAFFLGEYSDGFQTVCAYTYLGETYAIPTNGICPLSLSLNAPSYGTGSGSAGQRLGGYSNYLNGAIGSGGLGSVTGFLSGEIDGGLQKTCVYDVLGEARFLSVASYSICPVSQSFTR